MDGQKENPTAKLASRKKVIIISVIAVVILLVGAAVYAWSKGAFSGSADYFGYGYGNIYKIYLYSDPGKPVKCQKTTKPNNAGKLNYQTNNIKWNTSVVNRSYKAPASYSIYRCQKSQWDNDNKTCANLANYTKIGSVDGKVYNYQDKLEAYSTSGQTVWSTWKSVSYVILAIPTGMTEEKAASSGIWSNNVEFNNQCKG